ncbi:replication restart helicase PriA [Gracilimonas mengyeensis]|uniref:Replication restart protein PriA n=1 Tax=Gracilimonas mengyeensis TaxID=1302730 RepID=A0A521FGV1_9BACT|nr:primosomal protein N' [Gracilimonas mengyeensis]SMO94780.1 replication restart DNA helicase PriA [Gracilimonas mengyeensis]
MPIFVDVALPAAVRKQFTYHVPDELDSSVQQGQRVWIPFRNYYAIGVIVNVHQQKPSFKTKPVRKVLDEEPLLSEELLDLTQWISKFYYASWGETIQAALPAGLNFVSRKYLNIADDLNQEQLNEDQKEIIEDLQANKTTLNEAKKRWKGTGLNKVFSKLLKDKKIEIWEEPDMKVTVATEREWIWANDKNEEKARTFLESEEVNEDLKWTSALAHIAEELPIRQSEIPDDSVFTSYTLKKLQDEGWITYREVEKKNEMEHLDHEPDSIKSLNDEQRAAFGEINESLSDGKFANYLLFGITGSGKTEVYIHALKKVIESGKGGIVLVPEIALTPQTVSRFYRIFGDEIAVLHSRMTNRQRLQAWQDLYSGKKNIAIGPRSAVFAPVQNLGLIILDEEHDSSYKQMDPAPRYHARETAIMRAQMNDAVVIMGSATPSMQALNMAAKKKCTMLELNKRHANAKLPEVKVLDLKQYKGAMRGELAVPLFMAMEEALDKDEQIILLYNRRGYASYLQCEDCGHIPESPESSVSLTYHKRKNLLMDHYTGYSRRKDTQCENCGSSNLTIQGSGTQNIEEQLDDLFPNANVIRFDRDSTSRKGAHENILKQFGEGKADILIGTQLVAKGLDFPNVTVVGVVNADTELAFPSFQATERMYQLLSQVSGRSGRGEKPGTVFLQTRQPDNSALIFAKKHDHRGFARQEMEFRKPLYYPPFSRLIRFELKSTKGHEVNMAAHALKNSAERVVPDIPVLGPSPAAIPWMNKKFIWEVTLKIEPERGARYIEALVDKTMEVYEADVKGKFGSVRVNVNVDAIN